MMSSNLESARAVPNIEKPVWQYGSKSQGCNVALIDCRFVASLLVFGSPSSLEPGSISDDKVSVSAKTRSRAVNDTLQAHGIRSRPTCLPSPSTSFSDQSYRFLYADSSLRITRRSMWKSNECSLVVRPRETSHNFSF